MVQEKKVFILDGHKMKSLDAFHDEAQRVLCPNFKGYGRNWHAFNDILRGGFGTFEYGEEIILVIKYKSYIKKHLGEGLLKKIIKLANSNRNVELRFE